MLDRKSSFILSFFIGGLIGGSITFLLASSLMRTRGTKPARVNKPAGLRGEMEEQFYEEGIYCAPEGADLHYDREKDMYYSNEAE
jgi:hypothetical protein